MSRSYEESIFQGNRKLWAVLRLTLNHSTNEEVTWSIVDGVVDWREWFNNFSPAQEFASDDPRISNRWLKDTDHICGKKIREDKATVFVFWDRGFLGRRGKESIKVHDGSRNRQMKPRWIHVNMPWLEGPGWDRQGLSQEGLPREALWTELQLIAACGSVDPVC